MMYRYTPNYNLRIPPKYKIDWYDDFLYFANQLDTILKNIEETIPREIPRESFKKLKRWNSFLEFKENAEINEIGLIVPPPPALPTVAIKITDEDVVILEETGLYITKDKKYIQLSYPAAKMVLGWNIEPQEATERLNVFGNIKLLAPNSSIISKNNNLKFLLNDTQEVLELLENKILVKTDEIETNNRTLLKSPSIYIINDGRNTAQFEKNAVRILPENEFLVQTQNMTAFVIFPQPDGRRTTQFNTNIFTVNCDGNNSFIGLASADRFVISAGRFMINIPSKGPNKVLTCIDDNGTCEFREINTGGGSGGGNNDILFTFNVEQRGAAWGYGHFYKVDFNADNSSIRSTTSQYENPANLYMCPLVAPDNIKIVKIRGCIYRCYVQSATPQPPFSLKLRLQKNLETSRSLIGEVVIYLQYANGWQDDNLVYQTFEGDFENQNLIVNKGENFGIEFIGEEGNNKIIKIKGCFLQIIAKKI